MKHVKAFAIKFVATLTLLYIVLGLMFGMSFGEVFVLTAVLGVTAYLIGDLLILPRTNNTIATIGDYVLTWGIIYMFIDAMTIGYPLGTLFVATLGVVIFEVFFHRYLANNVLPNKTERPLARNLQYQTEVSEELTDTDTDIVTEENKRNE